MEMKLLAYINQCQVGGTLAHKISGNPNHFFTLEDACLDMDTNYPGFNIIKDINFNIIKPH